MHHPKKVCWCKSYVISRCKWGWKVRSAGSSAAEDLLLNFQHTLTQQKIFNSLNRREKTSCHDFIRISVFVNNGKFSSFFWSFCNKIPTKNHQIKHWWLVDDACDATSRFPPNVIHHLIRKPGRFPSIYTQPQLTKFKLSLHSLRVRTAASHMSGSVSTHCPHPAASSDIFLQAGRNSLELIIGTPQ